MPTASANRGTRRLNRCISPLDCMLDDVMHFFLIFSKLFRVPGLLFLVDLISAAVVHLKKTLTLGQSG